MYINKFSCQIGTKPLILGSSSAHHHFKILSHLWLLTGNGKLKKTPGFSRGLAERYANIVVQILVPTEGSTECASVGKTEYSFRKLSSTCKLQHMFTGWYGVTMSTGDQQCLDSLIYRVYMSFSVETNMQVIKRLPWQMYYVHKAFNFMATVNSFIFIPKHYYSIRMLVFPFFKRGVRCSGCCCGWRAIISGLVSNWWR